MDDKRRPETRRRAASSGSSEKGTGKSRPSQARPRQKPTESAIPKKKRRKPAESAIPKKKRRKRKVKTPNFRVKILTMLAVVAAVILGFTIFFKIQKVGVQNLTAGQANEEGALQSSYYTEEEIVAASGIELGDNLLTLNKEVVAARIMASLPYISEVQVKVSLPNAVTLIVTEFDVTYGICDTKGGWWLVNRDGRVLDDADETELSSHLQITGMEIQVPEIGSELVPVQTVGEDEAELEAKKASLTAVLQQLERKEYVKQIVGIDITASYDIILQYGTQYKIRLGNTEQLEYKMAYLDAILKELETYRTGTIDLTLAEGNTARFQPDE